MWLLEELWLSDGDRLLEGTGSDFIFSRSVLRSRHSALILTAFRPYVQTHLLAVILNVQAGETFSYHHLCRVGAQHIDLMG